jgi:hypothetical protein
MRITSYFEASLIGFAAAALLSGSAPAQTSSSTPTIGYYRFNVPAGNSAWVSGFVTKKDFQGQATSITGGAVNSTINQTGANWTAGAFNLHYVEILDGTQIGLVLDIVGNSASSLTVMGDIGPSGFNLAQNVKYCIRKHATLGTLFKDGAGLAAFSDLVTLFKHDGSVSVNLYDGAGGFVDGNDFVTPTSNSIIYPGQGFVITATGASQLTFGGNDVSYVKTTPTKIPVYAGKINLVGLIDPLVATSPTDPLFPSQTTLGTMGFNASGFSPFSDLITTYAIDGSILASGVFIVDGTNVLDGSDFVTNRNNFPVVVGHSFTVAPDSDKYYVAPVLHPVN